MSTVTQVVITARRMLDDPAAWTQGAWAEAWDSEWDAAVQFPAERNLKNVDPTHPDACRWCLTGAVRRASEQSCASPATEQRAYDLLAEKAEGWTHDNEEPLRSVDAEERLVQFNDYDHRPHDDVVGVMDDVLHDLGVSLPLDTGKEIC